MKERCGEIILGGVTAHEDERLAMPILEDSEEHGGLLGQVVRGQDPEAEGPHPALDVGVLHPAQLLRVVGVGRIERLRLVQARHLEAHLHVRLSKSSRSISISQGRSLFGNETRSARADESGPTTCIHGIDGLMDDLLRDVLVVVGDK